MHVWKYKPDLLDPPDVEEEDRAILQYLRHGGTLFGDRIGEIEGFKPAEKPYRKVPDPEPEPVYPSSRWPPPPPRPWEPQFIGPPEPTYEGYYCCNCNRSMPIAADTCSPKCQQAIDKYRERLFKWMGIK